MRIFTTLFSLIIISITFSAQAAEERHYMVNKTGEAVTIIVTDSESRLTRLFVDKLKLGGYAKIAEPPKDTPSGVQCEILMDRVTFQVVCSKTTDGKERVVQGVYCMERRLSMVGEYLDTTRRTAQR